MPALRTYRPIPQFYDAEYEYLDLVHNDIPFFLDRLGPAPRAILEIGVGTGRAATAFANAGHRVVGLDYSTGVLRIARQKRMLAGLTPREMDLLHREATNFNLRRRFDSICILFNTFLMLLTMKDQCACLSTLRRHLGPNGRLYIDVFNPNYGLLGQPLTQNIGPATFEVARYGKVTRMTDVHRNALDQTQTFDLRYQWKARGSTRIAHNRFTLTWFSPRELQLLIERNGLKIDCLFGDYDGSSLKAGSPRIIACCSKA